MRNRYLDLLRAAAIVRVIVYHLYGWPWLSVVLPAMGIMFALAGSLTAASLGKRPAEQVVAARLRRVLPPLWLLGVIAVPVMLVAGWALETDGEHPFRLSRLALWILPVGDPPGSQQGIDAWEPLWYIRAYVWFALLSPALFALYRRIGWAAVALPLALMGVLDLTGFALPETADAALWDFVTYGACFIAGFAHQDGRLARLRPWAVAGVAVGLGAAALYWLREHSGEDTWDLNDVSESQALWSLAFVLVALRWQPPMGWLARVRPLDAAVNLLSARAVTVYLWHNVAIAAAWPVLTLFALDDLGARVDWAAGLGMAIVLTLLAVLLFGWAEDLAARRRLRLWPAGGTALQAERAADERAAHERAAHERAGPPPPGAGVEVPARRQPSAAAAMSRMPATWPPALHPAGRPMPEPETPNTQERIIEEWVATTQPAGRHAVSRDTTRDLALPSIELTRDLSPPGAVTSDHALPAGRESTPPGQTGDPHPPADRESTPPGQTGDPHPPADRENAPPGQTDDPHPPADRESTPPTDERRDPAPPRAVTSDHALPAGRECTPPGQTGDPHPPAGGESRDLGLPVAGRRVEPLAGADDDGGAPDWFLPRLGREDRHQVEQ